jgi:hypothetical protein
MCRSLSRSLRVLALFVLGCGAGAGYAQSAACGIFEPQLRFADGLSSCFKELAFLSKPGFIAGSPSQSYESLARRYFPYTISATRSPGQCPFVQAFGWGTDQSLSLPTCEERLQQAVSETARGASAKDCHCEVLVSSGQSSLTRAEFRQRAEAYERVLTADHGAGAAGSGPTVPQQDMPTDDPIAVPTERLVSDPAPSAGSAAPAASASQDENKVTGPSGVPQALAPKLVSESAPRLAEPIAAGAESWQRQHAESVAPFALALAEQAPAGSTTPELAPVLAKRNAVAAPKAAAPAHANKPLRKPPHKRGKKKRAAKLPKPAKP